MTIWWRMTSRAIDRKRHRGPSRPSLGELPYSLSFPVCHQVRNSVPRSPFACHEPSVVGFCFAALEGLPECVSWQSLHCRQPLCWLPLWRGPIRLRLKPHLLRQIKLHRPAPKQRRQRLLRPLPSRQRHRIRRRTSTVSCAGRTRRRPVRAWERPANATACASGMNARSRIKGRCRKFRPPSSGDRAAVDFFRHCDPDIADGRTLRVARIIAST